MGMLWRGVAGSRRTGLLGCASRCHCRCRYRVAGAGAGMPRACAGRRAARTQRTGRLVCASLAALPLPHPAAPDSMPTHQAASPAGAESSRAISRHWSLRRWAPICAHLRAPIVRAVPSAQHPSAICGGDSQRNAHRRQSICAIWLGPSRPSVRLSIAQPKCACASPWPSASPLVRPAKPDSCRSGRGRRPLRRTSKATPDGAQPRVGAPTSTVAVGIGGIDAH